MAPLVSVNPTVWKTISFTSLPKLRHPQPFPQKTFIDFGSSRMPRIAAALTPKSSHRSNPEIVRPLADFHPDIWQDHFLHCSPNNEEVYAKRKQEHELLKEEVKGELLKTIEKPLEYLKLIDTLERLGITYHFVVIIDETLGQIYQADKECIHIENDLDLYHTSLKFRILRQHGYSATSNVFEKFMDAQANFSDTLKDDVPSILSLYEAAHLRQHGEDILEKALEFAKIHLKAIIDTQPNHPLVTQISRALEYPILKSATPLECRHFVSSHEQDPFHSSILTRFAKLDFDVLQAIYKEELNEVTRWKKSLDFEKKFPYAKVRLVEAHLVSVICCFEPELSSLRKACTMAFTLNTLLDDTYDAYGVMEELQAFTEAIEWWDVKRSSHLPCYMRELYNVLIDTGKKIEDELAKLGRANCIGFIRRELISICRGLFEEAKWREEKFVPTYDKYLDNTLDCGGIILWVFMLSLVDDEVATIYRDHKLQRVAGIVGRCMNDLVDYEWDKQRVHVAGAVECYMKQYGVSEEEARVAINNIIEDAWKDLNEEILWSTMSISMPSLKRIHNFCCACNYLYKSSDAYSRPTQSLKAALTLLFVTPAC